MADPETALATQLRNIEAKTGKTFAQLCRLIADSGLSKVGEQRAMLMQTLGLGYGDANGLALRARAAAAPAASGDPLDAIYAGGKSELRPLHQRLIAAIDRLGPYEQAAMKAYVSLRRKKQFATLGPATRSQVELGLNVAQLPVSDRIKVLPAGSMCAVAIRLSTKAEIDGELIAWIQRAYDSAG